MAHQDERTRGPHGRDSDRRVLMTQAGHQYLQQRHRRQEGPNYRAITGCLAGNCRLSGFPHAACAYGSTANSSKPLRGVISAMERRIGLVPRANLVEGTHVLHQCRHNAASQVRKYVEGRLHQPRVPDCTHEKMKGSSSGHVLSTSGILPASSDSVSQTCGAPCTAAWCTQQDAGQAHGRTHALFDIQLQGPVPSSIDSTCCASVLHFASASICRRTFFDTDRSCSSLMLLRSSALTSACV